MNKIEEYLSKESDEKTKKSKELSLWSNNRPCELCGCKDHVQLYRNVVGKTDGEVSGRFILGFGSVSGYISGDTKTLPVLSCKECRNEKEIRTYKYYSEYYIFWDDMFSFYYGITRDNKDSLKRIEKIYLDNPAETRQYMIENQKYEYWKSIKDWSPEIWAKAGFKIKKKTFKKKFLFFEWEKIRFPTWKELSNELL